MVERAHIVGSTLRLVLSTFAKTLPTKWPQGKALKGTTVKAATIKNLLPKQSDSYVMVLQPTTFPVPSNVDHVVKGKADDNAADTFRSYGLYLRAPLVPDLHGLG